MSEARFRVMLQVVATAALMANFVIFAVFALLADEDWIPLALVIFSIWCASPILWWLFKGLAVASRGPAYRSAMTCVGALLVPAYAGFHLLAWKAANASSTGGMAYLTIPFFLLIGTAVACALARRVGIDADKRIARDADAATVTRTD